MRAANFFLPSFIKAINENTEDSFRNIMSEPSPGVFTFEMLQPRFCEMLLAEVLSLWCCYIFSNTPLAFLCSLAFLFSYQVLIA